MLTEPEMRQQRKNPKFTSGQVVMVRDQGSSYPVKLKRLTRIGDGEAVGYRWFDTLNNIEYESRMRPLTRRERGEDHAD